MLFNFAILVLCSANCVSALLYPIDSETRERKNLDGLWSFVREPFNSHGYGFQNKWFLENLENFKNSTRLPVPCAYNDVTQSRRLRDHVGWVWYQTRVYVPTRWLLPRADNATSAPRVVLRFGSVNYYAAVFVNGVSVVNHTGGHLPFEAEISAHLRPNELNTITVAVNNTLSHSTIPPGEFQYQTDKNRYPEGFVITEPRFDFFNYAGILRPVYLYTTSQEHFEEIHINTNSRTGVVTAKMNMAVLSDTKFSSKRMVIRVEVTDREGTKRIGEKWRIKSRSPEQTIRLKIPDHHLWYPIGMGPEPGYLYTMTFNMTVDGQVVDIYRLSVGIRDVRVTNKGIFINDMPFYCVGYGMHEDADIRGRGFDRVVMTKDLNLLEWTGANCFRTSHYPYSEERFQEADRRGIAIVAETPGVGLNWFNDKNLALHETMLRELIARDRNNPSVIVWSLANEPRNNQKIARDYFGHLVNVSHEVDSSRPVTIVSSVAWFEDVSADLVDLICVNRYYGWYIHAGYTELIEQNVQYDLSAWHKKFNKPVILTEYGAGSLPGINQDPPDDFSEAYQVQVLRETHKALDILRKDFLTGEMVWNFADFATAQGTTRVNGNRKGIFTRNRQPKQAAYVMKARYTDITQPTMRDICPIAQDGDVIMN